MKIAIVCPYPVGCAPSQRLKYEQYIPSWTEHGYEVEVFPFWDEAAWSILYSSGNHAAKATALARSLSRRRQQEPEWLAADLVYVHLEMAPLGPALLERRLIESGIPFVFDVDDLVHLPHGSNANPFMERLRTPERVTMLMRAARHVVVCTPYLEELARRYNPNVTDISSTIDTDRYLPRAHRTGGPVVVGWSGSHSTAPYLHLLDDVLKRLAQRSDIRLRVIGEPSFDIPEVHTDASAWNAETEVADLSEIDIGVYPLPDEEWVLGKSGLKALQYMALAIPTVAERVGSNLRIIDDGRSGFLVSGEEEWLDRLTRLVDDAELRRTLGAAGRETVVNLYSVSRNTGRYLEVLESAIRSTT